MQALSSFLFRFLAFWDTKVSGWNRVWNGISFSFPLFRIPFRFGGLRIWWNWQTRYFEVVVGQPVQVQVLLCAPFSSGNLQVMKIDEGALRIADAVVSTEPSHHAKA